MESIYEGNGETSTSPTEREMSSMLLDWAVVSKNVGAGHDIYINGEARGKLLYIFKESLSCPRDPFHSTLDDFITTVHLVIPHKLSKF